MKNTVNYEAYNSFLGIFLLLLAGCQQDDLLPSRDQDKSLKSVRATTSSVVKSRTSLLGNSVIWENGDAIGIFSDVSDSIARYDLTGISGDEAQFESSKPVRGNTFYAFYPYAADAMVSGTNVSFCLSAEQSFNFDSFASGVCPMVAQSTTNSFRFAGLRTGTSKPERKHEYSVYLFVRQ